MDKLAAVTELTDAGRDELGGLVRGHRNEQRYVLRARIVPLAAQGLASKVIAAQLGCRRATVSMWRLRLAEERMAGLRDRPRSGQPRKCDQTTDQRLLAKLDEPPPQGHAQWSGTLLAAAVGDVPADQVRRILRRLKINLSQTRSWCINTNPEFAAKASNIVTLS